MAERALSILLVDGDEAFTAATRRAILASGPFIVDTASSVAGGVDKLRRNAFDICFMESAFAHGTGVDVLRAVERLGLRTACIILAEQAEKSGAYAALRHGALDYLIKSRTAPFDLVKCIAFALFRKGKEAELSASALRDSLTGLGNRQLFREQAGKLIQQAKRAQAQVGMVFMDVDGLKPVNDSHGHHAGDQLLQQVARRILTRTRESDVVARLGGDEFVALLPGIEGAQMVNRVASDLTNAIGQTAFEVAGHTIHVGMSCGTAVFPRDSDDVDELVRIADLRMYEHKSRRKAQGGQGRAMAWL